MPVQIVYVLTINLRAVRQVRRLLKAIYRSHHYYFIHVDKRRDYLHRELSAIADKLPNVRMATNRYATLWSGTSLLTMLLACMQELLSFEDWKWDYFLNLSETDYPLKTVEEFEMFLQENMGKNFVASSPDDISGITTVQGINMVFHECDDHVWLLGPRELQHGIRYDGGSDWICLTRSFTQYLTGSEDHLLLGLKEYWKHVLLPGESFFHTVLQNSEFCTTKINDNFRLIKWRRELGCKCRQEHTVDWPCGCSPHDFLTHDLENIQLEKSDRRSIFFGRKFESIINQEILNQVDTVMLGISSKESSSSFWLNEYHFTDIKTNSSTDDTVHSHYLSFARIAAEQFKQVNSSECSCNLGLDQLLEGTVYKHRDVFQGLIVTFNATRVDGDGTISVLVVEALYQTTLPYKRVVGVEYPFRLESVEIGTSYDPKEELFRNFGTLLGPHTDVMIKFVWSAGLEVNITYALIDPSGTIASAYDVSVSDTSSCVHAYITDLRKPILPGHWTVSILHNEIVVAETGFVVLPLSHISGQPINRATSIALHSGPGQAYADFSSNIVLAKLNYPVARLRKSIHLLNSSKYGRGLYKWIDRLILERWSLSEGCIVTGSKDSTERSEMHPKSCKMEACERVSWSTRYPDFNSDFDDVYLEMGMLKENLSHN